MIATFYSFKGGVGRTLALANIALALAESGHSVLTIDFDLEAPGLSKYYEGAFGRDLRSGPGLIDLLTNLTRLDQRTSTSSTSSSLEAPPRPQWRDYVTTLVPGSSTRLDIITSGRQDDDYASSVLSFNWRDFFDRFAGGELIETLRFEWSEAYDYVLIDSRTGITDSGGICTIQLPDVLVPVFTASEQSLLGAVDVVRKAQKARRNLARHPGPALIFPLPSRFDDRTENVLSEQWMTKFADHLGDFYQSWLPEGFSPRQVLERTKLPYVSFYSFGETLPIRRDSLNDLGSLGFALKTAATLIERSFKDIEAVLDPISDRREESISSVPARRTVAREISSGVAMDAAMVRASPPPAIVNASLGLLASLPGHWVGHGFSLVTRPDHQNGEPYALDLKGTKETLDFTAIGGAIPNYGSVQNDINLRGVHYLQQVSDSQFDTALHIEPGLWIRVPPTTDPPVPDDTYVREATTPTGSSILAQSVFTTMVAGGPVINPVDSTPFIGLIPALNQSPFTPLETSDYLSPFRATPLPPFLPAGLDSAATIQNPALVLLSEIAGQNITNTVVIAMSSTPVGGLINIPFLVSNANAVQFDANFWIETVMQPDGSEFLQVQYVQRIVVGFSGILWPHFLVGTLKKQ